MSPSRSSSSTPAAAARSRAWASIAGEVSIPSTRPAGRLRDRDRDAAVADGELDERPVGLAGELDVERNVLRHLCRPLVVAVGEALVPAHLTHDATTDTVAAWTAQELRKPSAERDRGRDGRCDELDDARVRYLGRKSELAQALRAVRDRETGMTLNALRGHAGGGARGRAARSWSAPRSTARSPRRSSTSRSPATSSRSGTCTRSRRRGARSRTPSSASATRSATTARSRRPSTTSTSSPSTRGTRRARTVRRSSSTTSRLLRTETSPSPDPRAARSASRRSTWSRSAAATGVTRSTRRTTRSSTSSRAWPSTAASRSPT